MADDHAKVPADAQIDPGDSGDPPRAAQQGSRAVALWRFFTGTPVKKRSVREEMLRTVSLRLFWVSALMLLLVIATFVPPLFGLGRFPVSWFCFGLGVVGGFVSIEQRLKTLPDEDLRHLASSWVNIVIHPFFGGMFALVLYIMFLAGLLEGAAFPDFSIPVFPDQPLTTDIQNFLLETYPKSGADFALLTFWSFAAGFSERLVPDMVGRTIGQAPGSDDNSEDNGDGGINGHGLAAPTSAAENAEVGPDAMASADTEHIQEE